MAAHIRAGLEETLVGEGSKFWSRTVEKGGGVGGESARATSVGQGLGAGCWLGYNHVAPRTPHTHAHRHTQKAPTWTDRSSLARARAVAFAQRQPAASIA